MFGRSTYIRRRKALLERLGGETGIAIFIGNVESPAQYMDNGYKWRQDSTWLYLFGIDEPRFAALVDLDTGKECIYADDYDVDDIIWTGPMPTVREQALGVGVESCAPYAALDDAVSAALKSGRRVHFVPASRYYNALKLGSLLGIDPVSCFRSGKSGCPAASEPLVRALVEMRLRKEPEEIDAIDAACGLGYRMHTVARRGIRPGRIEQEIVGEMEGVTLAGGWGTSFPTILTQHGEIFHCHSHDCPIEPGRLLVVDAGAESNVHYASDFTRTYPTGGKFTSRQRDIYQTVYECNELAFNMIKPGVTYLDCHLAVSRHILGNLSQIGLVGGSVDDMVEQGIAGMFMPHGLGHNMGLDVHDMEDYGEDLVGYGPGQKRSSQLGLGSLRMARILEPGNVITDEPGIYFIPELIEQWKSQGKGAGFINFDRLREYYNFGGIRLEDDVLVTESGARRLGPARLPIAPDDVEAAMAEER